MGNNSGINDRRALIKTRTTAETYRTICELLEKERRVYYTRFGDGDLFLLQGRRQANHEFSERIKEEIARSLSIEHPQYLRGLPVNYMNERGMTKGLFERYYHNDEMCDFLLDNFDFTLPSVFESCWFPNYYSVFKPREMYRFLERYIRPRKKMFIGSVPQEEIEKLFGKVHYYVSVPRRNSYGEIDNWFPEILSYIDDVELVLPAAGMATRVINKRLWDLDKELHVLDLGSIVDAVSSFPSSRKWIRLKRHVLNRILPREHRNNSIFYWIYYGLKETGLFFRYQYYRLDPLANLPVFPKAKRRKPGPFKRG